MLRKFGLLTLILALFGLYSWTQTQQPVEVASFSSTTKPQAVKPVVQNASRPKLLPTPVIATREQFEERFPASWQFLTSDDGTIRSILGGQAHGYENSAQGALRFAREIAPLLGAKPEELQLEERAMLNTPLRRAYRVLQTYQGYPVYQSQMTVFFLNGADTVLSLNSQLEKIERLQAGFSLSQTSAQAALSKAVALEAGSLSLSGPVLYVKEGTGYPAYVAVGTRTDLREGWEFVVDASTGEILHQYARNPHESARQ